ncbi:MAG: putative membrane protein [Paraglaciecola sp.]|jgi:uncharacterized membrane protein
MPGGFCFFLIFMFIFLMPLLFMNVIFVALGKLGIPPSLAPLIVFMMFVGSLVNIPILRESIPGPLSHHPLNIWGLERYWPNLQQPLSERVIAINLGGFVFPILLVCYEIVLIAWHHSDLLLSLGAAVLINIVLCYHLARPIPHIGITLPALIPGLVAAISALAMAPDMAPPIAFCAGVLGPVIGADLMKLKQIRLTQVGMASIGGAGTFDGIVISGLIAVLLS